MSGRHAAGPKHREPPQLLASHYRRSVPPYREFHVAVDLRGPELRPGSGLGLFACRACELHDLLRALVHESPASPSPLLQEPSGASRRSLPGMRQKKVH